MPVALLTAVDAAAHIHLIVGCNSLAAARCRRSLEVGAKPVLVATAEATIPFGVQEKIDQGQMQWLKTSFSDDLLTTLGREEVDHVVDAVFVTLGGAHPLSPHIAHLCRRLRIPVNVADTPRLCSFTLLSTYSDGPLQVGVTTSGRGCKLASRIRREIASALPSNLGDACDRLGTMRRRIWQQDQVAEGAMGLEDDADETGQGPRFNRLISQEDQDAARGRRLRWLSQICEYWPLNRLATITDEDVDHVLRNYIEENLPSVHRVGAELVPTRARPPRRKGRVILAGTGPGDPELLTTATLKAIKIADLILADKLVPAAVLALVPRRTDVHIARKFPGNAENAQEELLQMGLAGVQAGRIVVRLKQGDPYLYGRGAEEYDFFRQHGFDVTVLPGITSALSAPLFAQIPPTHRAVADQVLICTGTGQKGAAPDPPVHNPHQTVIFLMALHRLSALVSSLVRTNTTNDAGSRWPKETPCAVVERASCPDQRVIRTTLEFVEAAVEEEGSRPPGLLILGWSCSVLWHGRQMWVVEDGFKGLEGLAMDGWMMPPGSPVVPATELSPPDATNHVDLEAPRIVRDAEDAALFQ